MKDHLLKLIGQNRLEDVFDLLNRARIRPVLLQARFNRLKREQSMGLLLQSDYNDQHEDICRELIQFTTELNLGDGGPNQTDNDPDLPGPS